MLIANKMRLCIIEGCTNKPVAKGYCRKHYQRYWRYGSPYITKIEKHGMHGTLTYKSWQNMKERCNNPNVYSYNYCGARGISVCDQWEKSFLAFYKDMGNKPEGMQIDRIDNNGNYEPDNCHWATPAENSRNKQNTILSLKMAEEIRRLHKKGVSPKDIANTLGLKVNNLSGVLYNKEWT